MLFVFAAGALVANVGAVSVEPSPAWIVLALGSALIATLTLGIERAINAPADVRETSIWPVFIIELIVLGLVFSTAQVLLSNVLGLGLQQGDALTIVSTTIAVTVVGVAVIVLMRSRREQAALRLNLLEQAVSLSLARQEVADIVQRMQWALQVDIDSTLATARSSIEEQLDVVERQATVERWPAIADHLRQTAADTVRPLSQRLWQQATRDEKPLTLRRILGNVVTTQPFRPGLLVIAYLATSLVSLVAGAGWIIGLGLVALGCALIVFVLGGSNQLMRRWPQWHAVIFIGGVVVLELTGLISFPLRQALDLTPYTWGEFVVGFIAGTVLILITSALGSVRTYQEDVARTFRHDLDTELVDSLAASRQVAQLARESARVLHGSVQTRLIACAVAAERAAAVDDALALQAALREAQEVLTAPVAADDFEDEGLADEVARKAAPWRGLCEVSIDMDPIAATERGRLARSAARVVEEGIGNAIRHGNANAIHIRIAHVERGIEIVIDDDGMGPQGGAAGLGTAMLDSASSHWRLSSLANGSRLSVLLVSSDL